MKKTMFTAVLALSVAAGCTAENADDRDAEGRLQPAQQREGQHQVEPGNPQLTPEEIIKRQWDIIGESAVQNEKRRQDLNIEPFQSPPFDPNLNRNVRDGSFLK